MWLILAALWSWLPAARAGELQQLTLSPALPQVRRLDYASNGYIEVAHALVLIGPGERGRARGLMAQVAARALAVRRSLAEVDVSVYDRGSYRGFGGPLPLITASVPRDRLTEVERWAGGKERYERVWEASVPRPALMSPAPMSPAPMSTSAGWPGLAAPSSSADLLRQELVQAVAQLWGGLLHGLLFRGAAHLSRAALTFDDSPHPLVEPLLLDLLRRERVKATFFVIGRGARAYPYFVRDMAQQGHEVANHTERHRRLAALAPGQVGQEVEEANETIASLTGQRPRYFRPPGGDFSPRTLQLAQTLGLTTVFWTDDPSDFARPGEAVLRKRLEERLGPGGIVLLHPNAPGVLQVLPGFLRAARTRGIELVTVDQLARASRAR